MSNTTTSLWNSLCTHVTSICTIHCVLCNFNLYNSLAKIATVCLLLWVFPHKPKQHADKKSTMLLTIYRTKLNVIVYCVQRRFQTIPYLLKFFHVYKINTRFHWLFTVANEITKWISPKNWTMEILGTSIFTRNKRNNQNELNNENS